MKNVLFISFWFAATACVAQSPDNPGGKPNYNNQDDKPAPDDPVSPAQNYTPAPQQAPQRDNYAPPQNNYNNAPQPDNYNGSQGQVNYASPSYQTFYDDLSPYGYWINNPNYGYVWVPNAGPDFRPYCSNGHWVYTNYGWTWASNYNWGWAPFHYGRWTYDGLYGWMWIPGHEWAPAWVTWGSYNGYYGWAPIGPGAAAYEGYRPEERYWNYVPAQHFARENVYNYTFNSYSSNRVESVNSTNMTVINNSNNYNNVRYYSGPQQAEVEHATGSHVNMVTVNETSKPTNSGGNANQLSLYRPVINSSSAAKSAPAKIVPVETLKPVNNNGRPVQQNEKLNQVNPQNNVPRQAEQQNNQPHQVTPQRQEPVREQPTETRPNTQSQQQPQKQNNNRPNNQAPKPVKQQQRNSPPPAPKKK